MYSANERWIIRKFAIEREKGIETISHVLINIYKIRCGSTMELIESEKETVISVLYCELCCAVL